MDLYYREQTGMLSLQGCHKNINIFGWRSSLQIQAYRQGLVLSRNSCAKHVADLIEKFLSLVKPQTSWSIVSFNWRGMPLIISTMLNGNNSLSLLKFQDLLPIKLLTFMSRSIWLSYLPISKYNWIFHTQVSVQKLIDFPLCAFTN